MPKQIKLAVGEVSHSLETLPRVGCLREELITRTVKSRGFTGLTPHLHCLPYLQDILPFPKQDCFT